jgi:hypothetical protein
MRVTLTNRQAKLTGWIALLLIVAMYLTFLRPRRLVGFGNLTQAPLSNTRFIRTSHASTAVTTNTRQSFANSITDTSTKMSNIVHVVLFQFKPEVSPETVLDVHWPFRLLLYGGQSF